MVNQFGKPGKPGSSELQIVKHGAQERATITVPLVVGVDDDIIAAVNRLPKTDRQAAIKNAIRGGMAYLSPVETDMSIVVTSLQKIIEDVSWIMAQFEALRKYLDNKFARVGLRSLSQPFEEELPADGPVVASEETLNLRKSNTRKKW